MTHKASARRSIQADPSSGNERTFHVRQVSEEDESFCATLLPEVSRTFALSITVLPASLRSAVRVSYLLCRIVDTIEDDAVVRGSARQRLFDVFDELMSDDGSDPSVLERFTVELDLGAGSHDNRLCRGAGAVFRCFRALPIVERAAIRPHVLEMSRGMREYTERADQRGELRLSDVDELERYCYFVAGTVGKLLTSLFEIQVPDLPAHALTAVRGRAVSFGLALQMVNIVKDVATDLPRGDCFLPTDLAERHGIAIEEILQSENRDAGLAIIAAVCERAREHLERAKEYTLEWPVEAGADIRLFCAVPLTLALATLHEVERGDDTLRPGCTPKVSRDVVMQVFSDSKHAIQRNDTLAWMFSHYSSGAYLDRAPSSRRAGPSAGPSTGPAPASIPPESTPRPVTLMSAAGDKGRPRERSAKSRSSAGERQIDERDRGRSFGGTVLVTGAAGHLGANLVHRLVADGSDVRVLLRQDSNNAALDGLEIEKSYADLRDPEAVARAVKGVETVFHCAAKVSTVQGSADHKRDIWTSNVLGTKHLLEAARCEGVARVVVTGSFSATGYHQDTSLPADETQPFYPFGMHLPYSRSKAHAEHEVLKQVVEGLDVVMCTSTAILGPHDHKPSRMGQTLMDFANGKLRAYIPGGFEFVAARDIVQGHLLAMERGRTGHKYTIATKFLTLDDIMAIFERVTGRKRPRVRLNPGAMHAVAHVSSFVMTHLFPGAFQRFTPDAVRILRMQRHADTTKARTELGFEPTSIEDAVNEAYDDFARRGLVAPRQAVSSPSSPGPGRSRNHGRTRPSAGGAAA